MNILSGLILLFSFLVSVSVFSATKLDFSPQGSTKELTQVRAHFSGPVIEFGSSEAAAPFQIDCAFPGQARWVTSQDWVYDFYNEVPAGAACRFTLVLKKDLKGEPIAANEDYVFDTGGPNVRSIEPRPGKYSFIDEEQLFVLKVDGDVDPGSIKGQVYFQIPEIADAVPARIVSEDELGASDPDRLRNLRAGKEPFLLLQAEARFPSGKPIRLIWGKGLKSKSGVANHTEQSFDFMVRNAFKVTVSCEESYKDAGCSPIDSIFLNFSAEVPEEQWKYIHVEGVRADREIEKDTERWQIPGPHPPGSPYSVRFDEAFRDDAKRPLSPGHDKLLIKIGKYPPLVKFQGDFGILEAKGNPVLPVNLRSVETDTKVRLLRVGPKAEDILKWYGTAQRVAIEKEMLESAAKGREIRSLERSYGHEAFEVKGLPLSSGYYLVEIASADLGKGFAKPALFAKTEVLVTDLAVHWKESDLNSLVWVTSLATGHPVAGAKIRVLACDGREELTGTTDKDGVFFIGEKRWPTKHRKKICGPTWYHGSEVFFVHASLDQDYSFVFSDQNRGMETWRFGYDRAEAWENLRVHSILDRSLLRLDETLSGLAIARQRSLEGFSLPKDGGLAKTLEFVHQASNRRFPWPVKWTQGQASFQWPIPPDAPLGTYTLEFGGRNGGQFQVQDFRVATVKADLRPEEKQVLTGRNPRYHFDIAYLNGGTAGGSAVTLRGEILGSIASSLPDQKGYIFNKGPYPKTEDEPEAPAIAPSKTALDEAGHGQASLSLPSFERPTRLRVELEFPDPNGELRTESIQQDVWPAALQIGLKMNRTWLKAGETYDVQGLALDLDDKGLSRPMILRVRTRQTLSHRRRGIGGTYTYQHKTIISDPRPLCERTSDESGAFHCPLRFDKPGQYIIEAEGKDDQGRRAISTLDVWVAGQQDWYEADDNDRIDLIPEKKEYEPGEKARLKIKAPFPQALMLVAVEREGIESYRVEAFDAKNPIIEVPIEKRHAPNIYVSAWLMRGRSKGTEPFLKVDLGKPVFKLGIAEIKVGQKAQTLNVKVTTDRSDYQPRETAKVHINVAPPLGQTLPPDAQVTVAVVDEGLLELEANKSWDLLGAMMGRRPYAIDHATDAMYVVGKRHFGLKALPTGGGGGGRSSTRELFDTLLFWKASLPLKNGQADLEVPLNDSLSSFRIAAIAHAGVDLFGKGETSIRSSKTLSLISGLPPFARNGDRFQGELTLRNRSQTDLELTVKGESSEGQGKSLGEKSIRLLAQKSKKLLWDIESPEGSSVSYRFEATAKSGESDALAVKQSLAHPIPVQSLESELLAVDKPLSIPVKKPDDARDGELRIALRGSLAPAILEGPALFMQTYPYSCSEQVLSKAIALDKKELWRKFPFGRYLDRDGLMKFFPNESASGSPELTAYVLELSSIRDWILPTEEQERMLTALENFVTGRLNPRSAQPSIRLHEKIRALSILLRYRKLDKDPLLDWDLHPNLLPLHTLVDLFRIPVSRDHPLREATRQALLSRMEFRGSVLQLKASDSDYSLLGSPDATLSRLLIQAIKEDWRHEDLPELFQALKNRQVRGHWDTTVGNALGTLATQSFQAAFEKSDASGVTDVRLGDRKAQLNAAKGDMNWPWPKGSDELKVSHQGTGKPWLTLISRAAVPIKKPVMAGFQVERKVKAIEQKNKDFSSLGDIFEVELIFRNRSAQSWVSLFDPVPASSRILPYQDDPATYVERSFQGLTAYFDYLPAGEHRFRYRFQLNTAGTFRLPPTRVEAMYAPEVFALLPNSNWEVR